MEEEYYRDGIKGDRDGIHEAWLTESLYNCFGVRHAQNMRKCKLFQRP